MKLIGGGSRTLEPDVSASIVVTNAMLQASTNATENIPTQVQYRFEILQQPTHGTLTLSGSPATVFTQQDVNNGLLVYHHDGSGTATDTFELLLTASQAPGGPYSPA